MTNELAKMNIDPADIWQSFVNLYWLRPVNIIKGNGRNAHIAPAENSNREYAMVFRFADFDGCTWKIRSIDDWRVEWANRRMAAGLARELSIHAQTYYGLAADYRVEFIA